jgi:CDP-paratose 2-epimerase
VEIIDRSNRYEFKDYPDGISEEFPLDFHSPYGCSKGAADQYVIDYSRIFGLETVVFRQSCVYGYHQFGIEDQGWVAWFTIASLFDMPITIYGDGKQVRDVLFIDDLIESYWAAIENIHITKGKAYNIGGSQYQMSLLELLEYLETFLNKKITPRYSGPRHGDQLVFTSDIRKAKQHFEWTPRIDVKQGVRLLVDWVIANKELFIKAGIIK